MGEVLKYYDEKGKVPSYDILESLLMVKVRLTLKWKYLNH